MFWSDWVQRPSALRAKIVKANMDGSGATVWVKDIIQWPNGLSVDPKGNRLFWCDAFFDRLESVSMDNSEHKVRVCSNKVKNASEV